MLPAAADETAGEQYRTAAQGLDQRHAQASRSWWTATWRRFPTIAASGFWGARIVLRLSCSRRPRAEQVSPDEPAVRLGDESVPYANHSLVVVRRHPRNMEKAVGLLVVEPAAAFAGMARKLPHYGKYSYLAFEGDEPTNIVKGQWSADGSPLVVDLREDRSGELPPLAPEKRPALAELPPVFSGRNLANHVEWLAAPEREGRGLGSDGLRQSAEYIAKQMAEIGLQPGGDNGTWFQTFTVRRVRTGSPSRPMNVVGVLPGKRAGVGTASRSLSGRTTIIWAVAGPMCGMRFADRCIPARMTTPAASPCCWNWREPRRRRAARAISCSSPSRPRNAGGSAPSTMSRIRDFPAPRSAAS